MNREWTPQLPSTRPTHCVICGKEVTNGQRFLASKPRRGRLIVSHTECWEKEQQELKRGRKDANA